MSEAPSANGFQNDPQPQRHKHRFVLFSAKDEAMFSDALRRTFPVVRYLIYSGSRTPPSFLRAFDSLTDVPGEYVRIVVPESPEWQPEPSFDPDDEGWQDFRNLPFHRSLLYYRAVWDWAFYGSERISYDPPTLNEGQIFGSYCPWLPDHEEFLSIVRSVWRIVGLLATNRYKIGHPLGNKLMGRETQLMKNAKRGEIWIGHQALGWCHAHPRRMLSGGFRPCDDWQMPETEWYRALRRDIEERHGADFGDTPPPPWTVEPLATDEGTTTSSRLSVVDAEMMRTRSATLRAESARGER